jgi:simple sugar transport system permease protein
MSALARKKGQLRIRTVAVPVIGLLLALVLAAFFIVIAGQNPFSVYGTISSRVFGSLDGFSSLVRWAIPLMILGVSAAFSLQAGLWNLGMEGQLYLGALFSAWIGFSLKGVPGWGIDIVGLLVAGAAGFLWAMIPALLRAYLSVNEFITSLLLNFVAVLLSDFFVTDIWQDRSMGGETLSTFSIFDSARFAKIIPGYSIHAGIFIAIALIAVLWYVMRHTSLGYRIKIQWKNPRFLKYGGGSPSRTIILAMGISGCLSGIAGFVEIYGVNGAFFTRMFSGGIAWDGLVVALLGSLQPLGIFLSSFLFGFLKVALLRMSQFTDVSRAVITLTQTFIIFFIAVQAFLIADRKKDVDSHHE